MPTVKTYQAGALVLEAGKSRARVKSVAVAVLQRGPATVRLSQGAVLVLTDA